MNAIDTNVLIYRLDRRDPVKQQKARQALQDLFSGSEQCVLLWQVAGEFVRQLRAWHDRGRLTRDDVTRYAGVFQRLFPVVMPTENVLDRALDLAARYSLSHWDSMLLGACQEANVDTLYTEDMGAPIAYDGVQLVNPFN